MFTWTPLSCRARVANDEAGVSLVELVLAGSLGVVVVTVVASLFLSVSSTQTNVGSVVDATATGRLVVDSISNGVRNSSSVTTTAIGNDIILRARTANASATLGWRCESWYYSTADKTIRFKSSSSAIANPSGTPAQRSWALLAAGIESAPAAASVVPKVFAVTSNASGQQLALSFAIDTESGAASFASSIGNKAVPSGTPTCF